MIVTRPKELASRLSSSLRALGAEVLEIPAIKTAELAGSAELAAALERLPEYGWLVFTSQAGVDIFFDRLRRERIDLRTLAGVKIAAIGPATEKAVTDRGLLVDVVPRTYDAESLGKALARAVKPGERLLIPRARLGTPELLTALDAVAVTYDDIAVYDTVSPDGGVLSAGDILRDRRVDYVAFTSASTVRSFAAQAGKAGVTRLTAVCIGRQTAQEALKYGMRVFISDEISIDSIADKLVELHRATKEGV